LRAERKSSVLAIEPLARSHDRAGFDCGVAALNAFLRQTARQHQEKGISRTFVLVSKEGAEPKPILGFFTLSATEGLTEDLPEEISKRFPSRIPAIILARLAVDKSQQRKGLGALLIAEALARVAAIAQQLGVAGLFVDAKDESSAAFYRKYGFVPLRSDRLRLFLPLGSLGKLAGY
jgi:GNAT superfamily N-acetyltransferase